METQTENKNLKTAERLIGLANTRSNENKYAGAMECYKGALSFLLLESGATNLEPSKQESVKAQIKKCVEKAVAISQCWAKAEGKGAPMPQLTDISNILKEGYSEKFSASKSDINKKKWALFLARMLVKIYKEMLVNANPQSPNCFAIKTQINKFENGVTALRSSINTMQNLSV